MIITSNILFIFAIGLLIIGNVYAGIIVVALSSISGMTALANNFDYSNI